MANDVSAIIPRIFAMGVALVRKNSVMPRLVSNKSDVAQAAQGATVTVPVSQKMTAKNAVPGATSPTDVTPGGAQVQLSEWKDAEFTLTDKEIAEIAGGGPTGVPGNLGGLEIEQWAPAQMVEAVEALVVSADSYALGLFKDVYNVEGTAGTTPFSANLNVMREARRDVNNATTFGRRYCLINPDAAANALARPEIWRANETGSATTIISGEIGMRLGAMWVESQNVQAFNSTAAGTPLVNNAHAAGVTSLAVDGITANTVKRGDNFTIAGVTGRYTVLADLAGTGGSLQISPGLEGAAANDAAITFLGDHDANLYFDSRAFAFASRTLADSPLGAVPGSVMSAPDPISGITLRLQVLREKHRSVFVFDTLYGAATVRPELAARILG